MSFFIPPSPLQNFPAFYLKITPRIVTISCEAIAMRSSVASRKPIAKRGH
jgi:hypothetical protein